jgi:hypothetical protein
MIMIAIFFLILILIVLYKNKRIEGFNLLDTGTETNDCYEKSLEDCTNYSNCGIATIEGRKRCIFGDIEGPSFSNPVEFDQWTYKDSYDKHIFNDSDEIRDYNTWSTFYPIYDVFYPSPTSLASLF